MEIEKQVQADSDVDDKTALINEKQQPSDTDYSSDSNHLTTHIDDIVDSIDIGLFHYIITIASGLGFGGCTLFYQTISFIVVAACDLDINRSNKHWLSLAFIIGSVIGSGISGRLTDTYGRRKMFVISLFINLICMLACAFAYNYVMLVIMTGFNGCAYGGIATAAHSYVLEFFPRHSRGRAGAVLSSFLTLENLYNSAIALPLLPYPFYYAIGSIYFTSWRLYILISAIPALLSFCTLLFMPNSIRFVLAKNDKKAFRDVLNKIDQINSCFSTSRTSHDKVLYSKITTLDLQQNDIHSKIRKEERRNFADDIRELMKQPWRRRFILLSIVWIGYSIADHGFTIWLPTVMASYEGGKTCWHGYNKTENIPWNTTHLYNGVNSDCKSGDSLKAIILDILIGNLFSLPVTIFCFLLINRVGRKVLYIILASISGFCILMILLLDNRLSVMIIACIFTAITTNAWIPCKIWTTELFRTEFRSTVVGILFVIGYSGLIVGLILFAKLYYINCIATYTIFASLGLLSIIAALFLPDTSNSDIR